MNAEKGRVPNIVYGYDKTIGDYFNLEINKEEAAVIKQIFKMYTEEGYGALKIANHLNEQHSLGNPLLLSATEGVRGTVTVTLQVYQF